jgi:hypothetical protein
VKRRISEDEEGFATRLRAVWNKRGYLSAAKKKQARDERAGGQVLLAFHLFHRLFATHQLARRFASAWLINEDNQTAFLALVLLTFSFLRHSNSPPASLLRMNP